MIDVKEAVSTAMDYVQALYKPEHIPEFVLEEVELTADGKFWLVTVSFMRTAAKSPLEAMTGQHGAPAYKVVKIEADTGQVLSMKIRTV